MVVLGVVQRVGGGGGATGRGWWWCNVRGVGGGGSIEGWFFYKPFGSGSSIPYLQLHQNKIEPRCRCKTFLTYTTPPNDSKRPSLCTNLTPYRNTVGGSVGVKDGRSGSSSLF